MQVIMVRAVWFFALEVQPFFVCIWDKAFMNLVLLQYIHAHGRVDRLAWLQRGVTSAPAFTLGIYHPGETADMMVWQKIIGRVRWLFKM